MLQILITIHGNGANFSDIWHKFGINIDAIFFNYKQKHFCIIQNNKQIGFKKVKNSFAKTENTKESVRG